MFDSDFQPKMVGRETEIRELQSHLEKVKDGLGSTIFISGEAGIGKTRLLNELAQIAKSKGFKILLGNSLFESLTPYMPFVEALSSEGLEYLFAQEAPRVEIAYLVTHAGILIKKVMRQETELDPDIFAGMLITVSDFVKDSLSKFTGEEKNGKLNTLGYENHRILIESGKYTNLAVIITGRENEFLINDLKDISLKVNKNFGDRIKTWDGDDTKFQGIVELMKPLITSGKYDGIDYSKDDPTIKRNMLFENILLGVTRHAKFNPSLLCLEDLQWADPSTLALMHYVARNTKKSNLLILGTYRPEDLIDIKDEKKHHLIEALQLMSREDIFKKIELKRLGVEHMDEMLKSLLGKTSFTDEFKNQIHRETEGNPFFIISLLKMMEEENTIENNDGTWILAKDLKDANLPSKIQDVIERRLNRVKDNDRRILDYASVIGDEFTSKILTEVLNLNKIQLLEQLRTLEQNHKLIRSYDTNFKFDHTKIKEVLYSRIPTELCMEYHAMVASAIESLNKDDLDIVVDDLAFHYNKCQNNEKAFIYLIKAAEKATKDLAPLEAFRHYSDALKILSSMEDSAENKKIKLEILMALGDNCFQRGDWDVSLEYFQKVIKICDELNDDQCKAEGYRNIGKIHRNRNEWEDAIEFFHKGLEISEKIEDFHTTANIYYWLGAVSDERGEISEAKKYYGKCMEMAVNIGDSTEIADAYLGLGRLHVKRSDFDESLIAFKKAVEILEKTDDLGELAKAYVNLGANYSKMKEWDKAVKFQKKAIEHADKIGNIRIKGYSLINVANDLITMDDLATAIGCLDESMEIFDKLGERLGIAILCENYGTLYRKQKNWDKSIEYFERALKICNEINALYNCGDIQIEYGIMFKDKGDKAKARKQLEKALEIFNSIQNNDKVERVQNELSTL